VGVQTFADQGTELAVVNIAGVRPLPDIPDGGRAGLVNAAMSGFSVVIGGVVGQARPVGQSTA